MQTRPSTGSDDATVAATEATPADAPQGQVTVPQAITSAVGPIPTPGATSVNPLGATVVTPSPPVFAPFVDDDAAAIAERARARSNLAG